MCSSILTVKDIHTEDTFVLGDANLTIAGTNITFNITQHLKENRHYNITIAAANNDRLTKSSVTGISKGY